MPTPKKPGPMIVPDDNEEEGYPVDFPEDDDDDDEPIELPLWSRVLAQINVEKLEALTEVYGISAEAVLNVAISDQYDNKVAATREAEGD